MPVDAAELSDSAEESGGTPAPPAELVLAGRFDVGPDYAVHRARGAESTLLAWTMDGAGHFEQGGVEVTAVRGDLVVLGPRVAHSYAVAPGARRWSFWWVHYPARVTWPSWLEPYAVGEQVFLVAGVPAVVRDRIDAAFRRLHADARWSGHGPPPVAATAEGRTVPPAVAAGTPARELVLGRVEEVLVLATTATGSALGERHGGPLSGEVDPRVTQVEALVVADPAAPHTVGSLADHVALSPSRLAHLFSQQTGRTPMQAVRDARLRHAARLLERTDLPVASIAAASGFVSAFHFSRVFRARFGAPPKDYRTGVR
ncbi:helix-turn-helix domain-containing protein [Actinopolymorpha sp. B11F2]|uniref:helix-turn-helix domain-containing protein n=1 Tax=Actinopolymorpha sp. B11F2 TaxID=3160862 RepID=UPI0032E42298